MALKKTVLAVFGVSIIDAYHRVEMVMINPKNEMSFRVRSYAGSPDSLPCFADAVFATSYDMSGASPFEQAYLYLKTLPDFADATDC